MAPGRRVTGVRADARALDESDLWRAREAGTPDILIATANERNVRAVIETEFPPIQIYGTTGKNWQAVVIRHIPLADPCSSCLFPETDYAPTRYATGEVAIGADGERVERAAATRITSPPRVLIRRRSRRNRRRHRGRCARAALLRRRGAL